MGALAPKITVATFLYLKGRGILLNLDHAKYVIDPGDGAAFHMPGENEYKTALPIQKLVDFLNIPFMGNSVGIIDAEEEIEKAAKELQEKQQRPAEPSKPLE